MDEQFKQKLKDELRNMEERAKKGMCPICGGPPTAKAFRDGLSRREFHTSGMCQDCQDQVFGRRKVSGI